MEVGHRLQFHCRSCLGQVAFSVLDKENFREVCCPECGQRYAFDDETLLNHLIQFEALCRQIHASQDILGKTAIALDVGTHHVKVPFNILLTRMSSVIELEINGECMQIAFRIEPLKDVPEASLISS